jgi:dCTP deaminase
MLTILSGNEILNYIKEGKLEIIPFNEKQIGPASIDLTLGNNFRVFKKVRQVFHVTEEIDYNKITKVIEVKDDDHLLLMPGELVHGITKEKLKLPNNVSGRIEGRSRFARIGLMTHITAGMVQPGSNNKQVLEISNMSPMPIALHPGTKICQIILEKIEGTANYKGKFKNQTSP